MVYEFAAGGLTGLSPGGTDDAEGSELTALLDPGWLVSPEEGPDGGFCALGGCPSLQV